MSTNGNNQTHPNIGSSLDEFLQEEGILEETRLIAAKRVIAWQIEEQMKAQGLTKTALAAQMATSRKQLDRILHPTNGNVTLETLSRVASALGREIRVELV
jgi:antitoxin HicB